jgi:hypothetical protein
LGGAAAELRIIGKVQESPADSSTSRTRMPI